MQEFFEFGLGGRVLYKAGLAHELGQVIEDMGAKRVFVVADKGVVAAGLLSTVLAGLEGSAEVVGVLDDVPSNSSVRVVMQGAQAVREAQADVLIAIGGGSPIDTAKGMRIVATMGGDILDYEGYNVLTERLMPLIAVPTTAGTGSEVTSIAVILNEDEHRKIIYSSRFIYPDLAVLDPELTLTMPPRLTAATGMDALSHAIETFVSTDNNPFSDSLALAAIDLIATHLRDAVNDGTNLEARGHMLIAACMAGIACSNSFFGVIHAISHAVGAMFPVHHGTLNALVMPYGMQFNSVVAPERYVRIAHAMGVNAGGRSDEEVIADGINAVRTLAVDCGLPTRLRDVDVPESALPELAGLSVVEPAIFNNPRVATEEELLDLLREMW
ncbi:iron-containing alcohol dehydrogenase [Candidatus Chloroploca sp. M-50]|uniref:Iron-containing alcohol dehydrogenase n=1 Tax=Candidatus Chloroploca mongolica TaxID=2528176 RepID=A0ABS4DCM0_9CHLR|nr:iron-containing alcohol dehydrogenase [Candidatus Chloroploca mongolica]MBP1467190.1 iron-containing alcohol dehydrogenase [Candidatus Chloroploca mongolica]